MLKIRVAEVYIQTFWPQEIGFYLALETTTITWPVHKPHQAVTLCGCIGFSIARDFSFVQML